MRENTKRAVIIGATSGIGKAIAHTLLEKGWKLGIAGRREELLKEIQQTNSNSVVYEVMDVNAKDAPQQLKKLIFKLGGMDLYLYSAGYGRLNPSLDLTLETDTVKTNVMGFVTLIHTAFHFFQKQKYGHIAAITSVAGRRGIGMNASYSATKRFQMTYLSSLAQLANNNKYNISVSDIQPGFVKTDFINYSYPMQMEVDYVARKIVKGLSKKRRKIIVDWRYRCLVFVWHLIPGVLWERINLLSFAKK